MLKFLFHWILVPTIVPTSDWIFFLCNATESHVFRRNSPSLATVPTFQASVLELSKIRSGCIWSNWDWKSVSTQTFEKSIQKSKVKAKNWKKIQVNIASLSRSNGASSISKEKCGSNMYPAFLMTSSPALFGLEGQTKALDFSASRHGAVSSTRQS